MNATILTHDADTWIQVCSVEDVPVNGGVCAKIGEAQIAIFNFANRSEWYACQNECPHRRQMVLSRGITGSTQNEPKIACPFHKRTFSLITGQCMNDESCEPISTYPVRIANQQVWIGVKKNNTAMHYPFD